MLHNPPMHRTGPAVEFLSVGRGSVPARPVIGPTLLPSTASFMRKVDWESERKASGYFIKAAVLAVIALAIFGLGGAIIGGVFGFISLKLGALVIVLAVFVFGAAIQAINAGLYCRSDFAKSRERR